MTKQKRTIAVASGLAALACLAAVAVFTARASARAPQGSDDAKRPYQRLLLLTLDPGEFSDAVSFTVPAGKRFVVEQASAVADMPTGQRVSANVTTTGGGLNGRSWLALASQGAISGFDRYTTTQPTRMYADASTTVSFQASRSDASSSASLNFSVTGYLVDTP